ncbi:MAG: hypothetical protein LBJ82_05385 [Deltaproteobacteria bacterium]|nr:hypothetical protein [Deltaproteobacteria bacterium]
MGRGPKPRRGKEKVLRLRQYIPNLADYEIYAYGDTEADRPMPGLARHTFFRHFE